MDFNKLRADALAHGEDEEAVTVNTRALIDKVLARYSGEWTTLRELLQNAADAQATSVKIRFETLPSSSVPLSNTTSPSQILKHTLLHTTLHRLVVSNNGLPFGVNDWSRLKRIAEGNPDETKIGAFGVGFYSVFSDCEEPFVSSGQEAMAFYWKGNSLFTRKIQVPQGNAETSFVLDYRNKTSPIPNLTSLCQFLATSLTFVALQKIELWVDDWKILSLRKTPSSSVNIPIPKTVQTKTKDGLMTVQGMERESIQMDAAMMNVVSWRPSPSIKVPKTSTFGETNYGGNGFEAPSLRSFFSRLASSASQPSLIGKAHQQENAIQEEVPEDLAGFSSAKVFLSVTTASVRTSIAPSFAAELERATKKPPPKIMKLAILTSSYNESAASKAVGQSNAVANSVDVFATVLPSKKPGGRIFIGFPTHQTTGAGFHLSTPSIIPTVERESIDLNARWVRSWNIEMLRVAGIVTRLAFTYEMSDLNAKVQRAAESLGRSSRVTKEIIANLMPEAMHILQNFTFAESTPSSQVAQIIEEAFWTTYRQPSIEIYSTQGVLSTTTVRLASEDLSGFVEGIPVVPDALTNLPLLDKLRDFGLIQEITIGDVKKELASKALTKEQLIQFIRWASRKAIAGDIDVLTIHDLLDSTVATIGENQNQGEIISLSSIKYYRNAGKVPPELPGPPTCLPFELTRSSTHNELQALGWEPLEIVPWLKFLIESVGGRNGLSTDQDITHSPKFAAQALAIISKQWDSITTKPIIIDLLKPITVIPTKFGMKTPNEAYFASVKLFDDLPIVVGCQGVKEKVLTALGVRKTVELDKIFERLLNSTDLVADGEIVSTKWNNVDLITYLASVKDDIPMAELEKLRATPICAAEDGPPGNEASKGTAKRYKISELFEPKDSLRSFRLPVIQWPGKSKFNRGSVEGKFLSSLGLRAYPSVPELVNMMSGSDLTIRGHAMTYFIANHQINSYASFSLASSTSSFLPVQGDEKRLVRPSECFTSENAALLRFNVLRRDLVLHANKFGVVENPPITECVNRLIANRPTSRRDAIALFGYFAARLGEIGENNSAKLGDALIVPTLSRSAQKNLAFPEKQSEGVKYIAPRMCFIGDSETFRDIFDFVDFGNDANKFLLHCGSKHEPSRHQVATMLVTEPARVISVVQTSEKYLSLLRMLAEALPDIKRDKNLFKQMKIAPFLLATRESPSSNSNRSPEKSATSDLDDEYEETESVKQWTLQPASKIVVVDDYGSYRLFREELLCAPLEEPLENFYIALGASTIRSLVQDDVRLGSPMNRQDDCARIQKRILERSKIFLHEYLPGTLRHNSKWLETNLSVEMVSGITLRRQLRGYKMSHMQKQTATLNHEQRKGWVLWITSNVEMYHISQALVHHLLLRPTNQATTQFEFLLTSDLKSLKVRGYNVDRILRARAADARIAENERQKQLEAEQRQIKEQEVQWKQNKALPPAPEERRNLDQVPMPGAFGNDLPDTSLPQPTVPQEQKELKELKKPRGLFSNFTRRLGIENGEAQQQLQNFLGGHTGEAENSKGPPSYDESTTGQTRPSNLRPGETEKVTSPHALDQNLVNAVQASRSHDSSTVFSPPAVNQVKEQSTYCDQRPSQNITHIGDTRDGVRIFVSKDLSIPAPTFLKDNANALGSFSTMLLEVADVYGLPRKAMHVFYDEFGGTVAFNLRGSIFCNIRFFLQLHWQKIITAGLEHRAEAATWWWTVVAHELAHNLVSDHNSQHGYYTEMFVAKYFPEMMKLALSYSKSVPVQQIRSS